MARSLLVVCVAAAVLATAGLGVAYEHNLSIERTLSEILQDKRLKEAKRSGDASKRDVTDEEAARQQAEAGEEHEHRGRRAILPDIGYSPEAGAKGGLKFTDRDIRGLTLDLSGSVAMKGQYKGRFSLVAPDLLDGWLIALAGAEYKTDPRVEFFSLGNNEVGPDEISTNRYSRTNARLALAVRLESRLLAVVSGEYNNIDISRGHLDDGVPATIDLFPNLVGIHGGQTSPFSIALIFDDRDEVMRPVKGWNVMLKYQRIDKAFGNRFEFNRYIAEASYLYPLVTRRQVLGFRVAGEWIDGRARGTPFFEYSSLGGSEDMRGYFQNRFLGKSKILLGGEYRLKLFDFDFFDYARVKIDGVAFADIGRVFLDRDDLEHAVGQPEETLPETHERFRVSYGPGLRFAVGEAVLARVDIGFSSEEQGLAYLTFGHTF